MIGDIVALVVTVTVPCVYAYVFYKLMLVTVETIVAKSKKQKKVTDKHKAFLAVVAGVTAVAFYLLQPRII